MNAERLNAVLLALKKELTERRIVDHMQQMVNALRAVVQQSNSNSQNNLASVQNALYKSLTDTDTDKFSPTWVQILDEIGGQDLFGRPLLEKIQGTLATNQITLAVALAEFEELLTRLEKIKEALDKGTTALKEFGIGSEKLEPGECEVGILIPRKAVGNELLSFAAELKDLGRILNTFSEVATGKTDELSVRAISTSDFLVFLNSQLPLAHVISLALDKIIGLYKTILDLRATNKGLKEKGVPEEVTSQLEDHANQVMETGIEKFSVEIVNEFYLGKDKGRKNELKIAVRMSMNELANRIDRGFNVEVRCQAVDLDEIEDDEQRARAANAVQTIQSASANLKFLRLEGDPILKLPARSETDKAPNSEKDKKSRKAGAQKTEKTTATTAL
jgi:predicted transposase YbfD/YdcC